MKLHFFQVFSWTLWFFLGEFRRVFHFFRAFFVAAAKNLASVCGCGVCW
jgi:hypothetical protein